MVVDELVMPKGSRDGKENFKLHIMSATQCQHLGYGGQSGLRYLDDEVTPFDGSLPRIEPRNGRSTDNPRTYNMVLVL